MTCVPIRPVIRAAAATASTFAFAMLLSFAASAASAQATGAQLTREQKPVYPEGLMKIEKQGNVILTGRIDTKGKVQDIQAVAATNIGFVDPAVAAVHAWQFKPATRAGKPVDIAVNVVLRFRLEGAKRGEIPKPALGDLSIFPAGASGARSGPDGFPLKKGGDPMVRVESVIDVSPSAKAQHLAVTAEVISPKGRALTIYKGSAPVLANHHEFPLSFAAPVGADWEDGIWRLQIRVGDAAAGGGQFWLARDPEHFDFVTLSGQNAALARSLPPAPVPTSPPRPPATARPTQKTRKA